jgi:hypothetical protein
LPVRKSVAPRPAPPEANTLAPPLPALETITRFLRERPAWQTHDFFEVPSELFLAGRAEMKERMRARGFSLPVSETCPFENFLLVGKVIVQGE